MRDVEQQVEQHDLPRLVAEARELRLEHAEQRHDDACSAMSLNRKLPSVTRRASGGERAVDSIARRPLPRFAPSTSPSATWMPMTSDAASVAISSTTARLE